MKKWVIRLEGGPILYAKVIPRGGKGVWNGVPFARDATKFASKQDAESVAMLFASLNPEWIGRLRVRVWYGDRGGQP